MLPLTLGCTETRREPRRPLKPALVVFLLQRPTPPQPSLAHRSQLLPEPSSEEHKRMGRLPYSTQGCREVW